MFWILKGPKMAANFLNSVINNNTMFKGDSTYGCGQNKSGYNRLSRYEDDPNGNVSFEASNMSAIGQSQTESDSPIGQSFYLMNESSPDSNVTTSSITEKNKLSSQCLDPMTSHKLISSAPFFNYPLEENSRLTSSSSSSLLSPNDVEMKSFIATDYSRDMEESLSHLSEEELQDSDEDDEALTCNVCDRSYSTLRHLLAHQMKRRHYGCSVCEDIFPSFTSLETHKEISGHISDEENIFCDEEEDEEDDFTDEDEEEETDYEDDLGEGEEDEKERLL